jgi:hypothetical protein
LKSRLRPLLVRYRHLGIADADVVLASYPRSGSTWLRFMVLEMLTGENADFDLVNKAIPYIGRHRDASPLLPRGGRLIKTHELYRAGHPRVIYLVRDARGVLPSLYRQQRRAGYPKDLEAFAQEFVDGTVGPFGSWVDHVNFWLGPELSTRDDLLLVRFEDLREDPATVLREVLSFLGVGVEEPRLASAIRNNDLSAMKKKEREASRAAILNRRQDLPFVRSGSPDGGRELDAKYITLVELSAGHVLQRLGYQLAQPSEA